MSAFPPIESLVPHGEAIRELESLVEWAPGRAACRMRVSEASRLVAQGGLEAILLLEPMAQAVAACLGYEAFRAGEGVRVGMIVACRALRTRVASVPVGTALRIVVERVQGNDATSHFECAVLRDGEQITQPIADAIAEVVAEPIATATLTIVHPRSV